MEVDLGDWWFYEDGVFYCFWRGFYDLFCLCVICCIDFFIIVFVMVMVLNDCFLLWCECGF